MPIKDKLSDGDKQMLQYELRVLEQDLDYETGRRSTINANIRELEYLIKKKKKEIKRG
jgi:hypothetical protein